MVKLSPVKSTTYFGQNQAIHLARRDVYFERAEELILAQQQAGVLDMRIKEYEEIIFLLRVAQQHANFSICSHRGREKDEQFARFINLLEGNVNAVISMLNLKQMVEDVGEPTLSFLGGNHASIALQAEEYQRRASDIVRSIHNTLLLAKEPLKLLKEENAANLEKDELERYEKARKHMAQLVKDGRHRYTIAPSNYEQMGKVN